MVCTLSVLWIRRVVYHSWGTTKRHIYRNESLDWASMQGKRTTITERFAEERLDHDPPCRFDGIDKRRKLGTSRWECRVQERSIFVDMLADNNLQHRLVA
jgi:hypothetical protein